MLESVYKIVLHHELRLRGLSVEKEVPIAIQYDQIVFESAFRADLIVEGKLIIELKSQEQIDKVHRMQMLTYLRLTGTKLGLLINFGECTVKEGIHRIVNGLKEEPTQ